MPGTEDPLRDGIIVSGRACVCNQGLICFTDCAVGGVLMCKPGLDVTRKGKKIYFY